MSGGVDSSVSAALLLEQGYDVIGVFIKAWEPAGFDCGWREERREAMRVAAKLDIPFITLDLSKEYKRDVVDYMMAEYKSGRTPNPDVMCNKAIKFGAFFRWAMAQGADYVATGHYARVIKNYKLKIKNCNSNSDVIPAKAGIQTCVFQMLAGVDKNKDQTYFLWTLGQEQLAHTLFPVGHLQKEEVRKLAKKFGLPNEAKKDSQGLCFIGKLDVKDFLKEFIPEKTGDVLDVNGKIIGQHEGVLFYTLGERHGLEIFQQSPEAEPLYIIAKDLEKNTLTVGTKKESERGETKKINLRQVSWTVGEPEVGENYSGRVRYREPLVPCDLKKDGQNWQVIFAEPQIAAHGQSVVIYDGEICLGGGVIQ